ncbi:hypothetical protein E2562_031246 [Oryza meyeriana var. granulata]|uniref:Alcohol dehydrogenase-like N-terminal domain-containing protein n=1 Tax=Oryza meyeriana var. granulata TaxID=110450 RepID=A0A6G1DQP6_9ORYZ|nr:hypothetical protein E2562_031246 [Oryza meyeriana var. granulata]
MVFVLKSADDDEFIQRGARNLDTIRVVAPESAPERRTHSRVRVAIGEYGRRVQEDDDVTIKVVFCGICHTDLHIIKNEWGNAMSPGMVIAGAGDISMLACMRSSASSPASVAVAIDYLVDSCRACDSCGKRYEN